MCIEKLCNRETELAVCKNHLEYAGQRDCIQYYRSSYAKWTKAMPLSHLCNGEAERPEPVPEKGNSD